MDLNNVVGVHESCVSYLAKKWSIEKSIQIAHIYLNLNQLFGFLEDPKKHKHYTIDSVLFAAAFDKHLFLKCCHMAVFHCVKDR